MCVWKGEAFVRVFVRDPQFLWEFEIWLCVIFLLLEFAVILWIDKIPIMRCCIPVLNLTPSIKSEEHGGLKGCVLRSQAMDIHS